MAVAFDAAKRAVTLEARGLDMARAGEVFAQAGPATPHLDAWLVRLAERMRFRQTATGIVAEGSAASGSDMPTPLPCQALDHSTGYLAAVGA